MLLILQQQLKSLINNCVLHADNSQKYTPMLNSQNYQPGPNKGVPFKQPVKQNVFKSMEYLQSPGLNNQYNGMNQCSPFGNNQYNGMNQCSPFGNNQYNGMNQYPQQQGLNPLNNQYNGNYPQQNKYGNTNITPYDLDGHPLNNLCVYINSQEELECLLNFMMRNPKIYQVKIKEIIINKNVILKKDFEILQKFDGDITFNSCILLDFDETEAQKKIAKTKIILKDCDYKIMIKTGKDNFQSITVSDLEKIMKRVPITTDKQYQFHLVITTREELITFLQIRAKYPYIRKLTIKGISISYEELTKMIEQLDYVGMRIGSNKAPGFKGMQLENCEINEESQRMLEQKARRIAQQRSGKPYENSLEINENPAFIISYPECLLREKVMPQINLLFGNKSNYITIESARNNIIQELSRLNVTAMHNPEFISLVQNLIQLSFMYKKEDEYKCANNIDQLVQDIQKIIKNTEDYYINECKKSNISLQEPHKISQKIEEMKQQHQQQMHTNYPENYIPTTPEQKTKSIIQIEDQTTKKKKKMKIFLWALGALAVVACVAISIAAIVLASKPKN